jgi:hypothetical protein
MAGVGHRWRQLGHHAGLADSVAADHQHDRTEGHDADRDGGRELVVTGPRAQTFMITAKGGGSEGEQGAQVTRRR